MGLVGRFDGGYILVAFQDKAVRDDDYENTCTEQHRVTLIELHFNKN